MNNGVNMKKFYRYVADACDGVITVWLMNQVLR